MTTNRIHPTVPVTTDSRGFTGYETAGLSRNCPLALQVYFMRRERIRQGLRRNDLVALRDAFAHSHDTNRHRSILPNLADYIAQDDRAKRAAGGSVLRYSHGWLMAYTNTVHGDEGRRRRRERAADAVPLRDALAASA